MRRVRHQVGSFALRRGALGNMEQEICWLSGTELAEGIREQEVFVTGGGAGTPGSD